MARSKPTPTKFTFSSLSKYKFVELTNLNPVTKAEKIVVRFRAETLMSGNNVVLFSQSKWIKTPDSLHGWERVPHSTITDTATGKDVEAAILNLNFRLGMRYPDRKKIWTLRTAKKTQEKRTKKTTKGGRR